MINILPFLLQFQIVGEPRERGWATESNWEMDPIQSPKKHEKLIAHFEKAPGPSQTQGSGYKPQGTKKLSHSILLVPHTHGARTCSLHGIQEGVWVLKHNNGLQLETHAKLDGCWTGLDFNMEQKLWAVTFTLALLKTRLYFSMVRWMETGHWEVRRGSPLNCTSSVNHTPKPHPPMWVSGNSFPYDTARTPLQPITERATLKD